MTEPHTQPAITPELEYLAKVVDRVPATVAEVREWLRSRGYTVGTRGRLSGELRAFFTETTGRPVK